MASKQHTLRVAIAQPKRDINNDDFVLLEQEPWDLNTGYITHFGLYQYINGLMFSANPPSPKCPDLTPRMVYAYPSRPDLNYKFGCSWGTLGPRIIVDATFRETIQCNLEIELTTAYPPQEIVSWGWIGGAWTEDGEPIDYPVVETDGNKIILSSKVYGTLAVNYKVCRHKYALSITPRPTAIENRIQSHVYAIWDGGNEVLEIKHPEGTEEEACNYNIDYTMDFIDNRQPPTHVDPEDINVEVDYCTGEPL